MRRQSAGTRKILAGYGRTTCRSPVGDHSPLSDDGFCATCNRGRLTSLGGFRPCLGNDEEVSLRDALRGGRSAHEIEKLIRDAVHGKLAAHNMHDVARAPRDAMTGIGG